MQTQSILTNISVANQTAVPSEIRKLWQIKPGDKILWTLDPKTKTVGLQPVPAAWGAYMRGLGKNTWPKDATAYVKTLREDRHTS